MTRLGNSSRTLVFFFMVFFLLGMAAEGATSKNKPLLNVVNLYTEETPNFLIDAKRPTFIIKLKSNPTTGYSWFLHEYDSNLILPIKHSYQAGEKKLMGAPGYEFWTFRIKRNGFIVPHQTGIRFIYARPAQGSDNSTQLVFRISTQGK